MNPPVYATLSSVFSTTNKKKTIKPTLTDERILIPAVLHVVEALKEHKKSKIFKYTTVSKLFKLINNS